MRSDRAELARALAAATRAGAVLLIARLDRLARNVAFVANLLESMAADMPEANRFVLHIMTAVAEREGRAISERTRAALAAAKARGIALGWSIPSRKGEQRLASVEGAWRNALKADQDARTLLPLIRQIGGQEVSLRQIAAEWNARGVRTARGARGTPPLSATF
ncbi:recombinase family protein [Cereibacter sphaeroides]|uniref:recombinase family protein n=1 Tax=Cereibacter sphaeroides TaxID=1063 RepID=UPI003FCCAC0D